MRTMYYRVDKVSQGMGASRTPLPRYQQLEGTTGLPLLRMVPLPLGMGLRASALPLVEVWAFGPYHRTV